MDFTLDELSKAYALLSDAEKEAFNKAHGLVKDTRKNRDWKPYQPLVKAYAEEKKQFSLSDLKRDNVVPSDLKGQTFKKCIIKPLCDQGLKIHIQQGVLKRNESLYHLEGHAVEEVKFTSVFEAPSVAAAVYVVEVLVNGRTGNMDFRKSMTHKQFPFMNDKSLMSKFERLLRNEAQKHGWRFGQRPFHGMKEVRQ